MKTFLFIIVMMTAALTVNAQYSQQLLVKAQSGDATAQYELGKCYYDANGIERDYAKAYEWFYKAAEQHNANAQNMIGICHYNGNAVAQDYKKAAEWFEKSAKNNLPVAQYNLAYTFDIGLGVEQNDSLALYWYQESAQSGNADALNTIGMFYYKGRGGLMQNYKKALVFFKESALKGNKSAQSNTGFATKMPMVQKKILIRLFFTTKNRLNKMMPMRRTSLENVTRTATAWR